MEHPLQTYRKRVGLTVKELADRLGTSKASLSRIENRKQDPSLALMRRIAEVTGGSVTANDFLPHRERAA